MLLALIAGLACSEGSSRPVESTTVPPADPVHASALDICAPRSTIELEVVASGLDVPWDIAFLSEGRILLTERAGRIRHIDARGLHAEPWAVLPVEAIGESGLLGIDVARDRAGTEVVYVAGTFRSDARAGVLHRMLRRGLRSFTAEEGYPIRTRVLALSAMGEEPEVRVVVDGVPAGQLHAGGALRVGPDGALWLGTGDGAEPELSQRTDTRAGKLLRYSTDGRIAPDGPERGSPIHATGFRNVQGLAWRPGETMPWAIDHGPSGLVREHRRRGQDELNRIVAGANYGWPRQAGADPPHHAGYMPPVIVWSEAIAPAGLAAAGPGPWEGDLLIAALRGRDVFRVAMQGDAPRCMEPLLEGRFGRMRAVRAGPDGWIYITTSNRDGRGSPGEDDDYLLRLRPVTPSAPRPPE